MPPPKLDVGGLLARQPLFLNLSLDHLSKLARVSQQIRVPKHGIVFHRGDVPSGMYLVAVGRVKLAIPSPRGQEKVIEFFEPGQAFGEALMFLEEPYIAEAQALEDSLLIWIDKQDIYAVMEADPMVARRMLAGVSARVRTLMLDIETVNLQNAVQRVAGYLLGEREGDTSTFRCNKSLIASKLGLTPETLSRILHQLSEQGLISVDGREVHINNLDALQQAVFGGESGIARAA